MSFLKRRPKPSSHERVVNNPIDVRRNEPMPVTKPVVPIPTTTQPVVNPVIVKTAVTLDNVTAILVNFKTLDMTKRAYNSLTQFYAMPIIVVDNGSQHPPTTEWVRQVGGTCNVENLGHGPAMAAVMPQVKTRYVLTFDSDCLVLRGGWLEQMVGKFTNDTVYAVGWLRYVDRWSGVPVEWHLQRPHKERFVGYIHPAVGLFDVAKYRTLRPFIHHGAPVLWNMLDAEKAGYGLIDFPVFNYVKHLVAGTRRMYGGRWNPETSERPGKWIEKDNYPI